MINYTIEFNDGESLFVDVASIEPWIILNPAWKQMVERGMCTFTSCVEKIYGGNMYDGVYSIQSACDGGHTVAGLFDLSRLDRGTSTS